VKHARKLIDGGENPRVVARMLGVDRSTLYSKFREAGKVSSKSRRVALAANPHTSLINH
jgi:hypothetical protein